MRPIQTKSENTANTGNLMLKANTFINYAFHTKYVFNDEIQDAMGYRTD